MPKKDSNMRDRMNWKEKDVIIREPTEKEKERAAALRNTRRPRPRR